MMDIHELRELMMDLECMTALRHVLKNPAIDVLSSLLCLCAQDQADPDELTARYCDVYDAWLTAQSRGRGGFAREALESTLFEDSPAATICARMDAGELPYSLVSALAHDLEALGRLTAVDPAMLVLLCERAGMPGKTAARLPMWEPARDAAAFDPRISRDMLSRGGARSVAAFFRKHGTGLFARYPGCTWVG